MELAPRINSIPYDDKLLNDLPKTRIESVDRLRKIIDDASETGNWEKS